MLQIPNIISAETTVIGGNVTFGNRSYQRFYASGLNYQNSKFGYITEGGTDYIFSHGVPTANMPTSGSARYTGAALSTKAAKSALAYPTSAPTSGKNHHRGHHPRQQKPLHRHQLQRPD